jgi:large subunit ribosomal protein L33
LTCPARPLSSGANPPGTEFAPKGQSAMAKPTTQLIKMVSTADTGYFYVAKKNPRTLTEKLTMRKYDPRARKHVLFKESKMK